MKKFKREVIRKVAQQMANFIYNAVLYSNTQQMLEFWCGVGILLDMWCIDKYDIYLE